MVSCGRDNIRLWRVRNGTLRSCPVNLGEYHSMDFTDVAFEEGNSSEQRLDDRTLWVSKQVTENVQVYVELEEVWIFKKNILKTLLLKDSLWFSSHRFASSRSGYIIEIDYSRVVIRNVRRLLPAHNRHANGEKLTFNTGASEINHRNIVFVIL